MNTLRYAMEALNNLRISNDCLLQNGAKKAAKKGIIGEIKIATYVLIT